MQETVLVDDRSGSFRILVIPFHDVVPLAAHLAGSPRRTFLVGLRIEHLHLDVRKSPPDGRRANLHRIGRRRSRHTGRGFGQAVYADDLLAVHFVHHLLHRLDRAGRAGHDPGTQRTQVEHIEHRMVQLGDEHRRHAVQRRTAFAVHRRQHFQRIEILDHHHRRTVRNHRTDPQHAAETMEQRHANQQSVGRSKMHPVADRQPVVQDIVTGQHHPFRESGRPGRILHIDLVVTVHPRLGPFELVVADQRPELHQFGSIVHAAQFLLSDVNHVPQLRKLLAAQLSALRGLQFRNQVVQDLHIVAVAVAVHHTHRMDIGVFHDVFEFGVLVVRIDGHQYGPDLGGRKHERHPVGHVFRPYADFAALGHPDRQQPFCKNIDPFVELLVSKPQPAVRINHELMIRIFRYVFLKNAPDGIVDQFLFFHFLRNPTF